MTTDYLDQLQKVFEIQKIIQDIHPFLENLFPVAIVENNYFLIFDTVPNNQRYSFVRKAAVPMPIPKGVRAAFPLESYDSRMACVVTGDVFDNLNGYVSIFHEFIHCKQCEICNQKLKLKLEVARKAQEVNDYMWEINHPFPYADPDFSQLYHSFLNCHTLSEIEIIRQQLKHVLKMQDYEYMVWQEWNEGFARFIENHICRRLGLPENYYGKERPFHRISFYVGGEHYIERLSVQETELTVQIETLFYRIFSDHAVNHANPF